MDMIGDSAIVLYNRSAIDDAVFANDRIGVDDNAGHYDGPGSYSCGGSDDGSWMNKRYWEETVSQHLAEASGANAIIAYGNDERASWELVQFLLEPAEN